MGKMSLRGAPCNERVIEQHKQRRHRPDSGQRYIIIDGLDSRYVALSQSASGPATKEYLRHDETNGCHFSGGDGGVIRLTATSARIEAPAAGRII